MARSTYRMRDLSGIEGKHWDHCVALEKRGFFGWKRIKLAQADGRGSNAEAAVARCIKDLTWAMELDAKNKIIAEF